MERLHMKLEVSKGETLSKLNELFRRKVQLEEEQKENEAQLQFQRGVLEAFDKAQQFIAEIHKGEKIEAMRAQRAEAMVGGDGDKDKEEIPEKKTEVKKV